MKRTGVTPARAASYLAVRLVFFALSLLPRKAGRVLGGALGRVVYYLSPRHRRIALKNLRNVYPGAGGESRRIARDSFTHMGRICVDAAYFPRILATPTERLVVYEGVEHLHAAQARGRGALVFSGHFGHWELIALLQHRLGHPMTMVARQLENPLFDRYLTRLRERSGNRVISKRLAARGVLRALRGGGAVALLIDQNVRGDAGLFVDFLDRLASTTPSLATLAFKSRAPIVPVFSYPLPDGRWLIRYLAPIDAVRRGALSDDIFELTRRCTRILEEEVRNHPGCWLWMHDRWRTRPRGNGKLGDGPVQPRAGQPPRSAGAPNGARPS